MRWVFGMVGILAHATFFFSVRGSVDQLLVHPPLKNTLLLDTAESRIDHYSSDSYSLRPQSKQRIQSHVRNDARNDRCVSRQ